VRFAEKRARGRGRPRSERSARGRCRCPASIASTKRAASAPCGREVRPWRPRPKFSLAANRTTRTVRRGLRVATRRAVSSTMPHPAPSSIAPRPRIPRVEVCAEEHDFVLLRRAGDLADDVRRCGIFAALRREHELHLQRPHRARSFDCKRSASVVEIAAAANRIRHVVQERRARVREAIRRGPERSHDQRRRAPAFIARAGLAGECRSPCRIRGRRPSVASRRWRR